MGALGSRKRWKGSVAMRQDGDVTIILALSCQPFTRSILYGAQSGKDSESVVNSWQEYGEPLKGRSSTVHHLMQCAMSFAFRSNPFNHLICGHYWIKTAHGTTD